MSRNLPMIVQSLREHWPARKIEWLMTAFTISWGGYALSHPVMFYSPATAEPLAVLRQIAENHGMNPAILWGGGALSAGLLRGTALFVNGAYARTPLGRLVAAFVTMFIFTQFSLALFRSGVPNLGLIVYPWLVLVDMLSAYRAGQDAVYAELQRRSRRGTLNAAVPYLRAE